MEKYNEAYFLRKDSQGNSLSYGVEGIESFSRGELREHDREILSRIQFSTANVLEFGFGRGETIKYIWEQGASSYTGVDFSSAACNIAKEFLQKYSITGPQIICSDAVESVRKLSAETDLSKSAPIDVLVMLDFVEHIPRAELREILQLLRPLLAPNAVVVVNTPEFLFDNDIMLEGINESSMDSSDLTEETKGMHCNRYTSISLRQFFQELDYLPISRGHYFALPDDERSAWDGDLSYRDCWNEARRKGARLKGPWIPEKFETAYEAADEARLHCFNQGNLKGITIHVAPSYLEYYDGGEYDEFLIRFASKYDFAGKTVFDLGAFVGVNSLQFARMVGEAGTVCAFEPNPFNADRLKQNVSENPELSTRIKLFPFAVSSRKGTAKFNVHRNVDAGLSSASYLEGSHTTLSEQQLSHLGFTSINITLVTLDEFVERTGFVPDCLKIDIEGAEHSALAGATRTLAKYRPVLLIELHSIFCAIATLKLLMSFEYNVELLHIEPDGRCFIGADAGRNPASTADGESPRLREVIHAMQEMEFRSLESKLRISTKDIHLLKERLTQECSLSTRLTSELAQRATETKNFNWRLEQSVRENAILQSSLDRYRNFPLIRILRRLWRVIK